MTERLTTLAAVKDWLEITGTESDPQLIRLVDAASQFILNWLNRDSFAVRSYTYNFRGFGRTSAILPNWPIQSGWIDSVGVGGSFVPSATQGNAGLLTGGYGISDARFGPQSVDLYGYGFWAGAPSQVIYRAGFRTSQSALIPATPFQLTPTDKGQWIENVLVKIDTVEAVKVIAAPVTGQYSVDDWGTYTFALADVGKTAEITYDYVPWDVSFAAAELIGEWYKRKDRIGLLSKTLGGQETVTFSQKDMGDSIRSSLQPYVNVVPL